MTAEQCRAHAEMLRRGAEQRANLRGPTFDDLVTAAQRLTAAEAFDREADRLDRCERREPPPPNPPPRSGFCL